LMVGGTGLEPVTPAV